MPNIHAAIGTIELRQNLAAWLRKVEAAGDVVPITSNGRPAAVLIPTAMYEQLLEMRQQDTQISLVGSDGPSDTPPVTT